MVERTVSEQPGDALALHPGTTVKPPAIYHLAIRLADHVVDRISLERRAEEGRIDGSSLAVETMRNSRINRPDETVLTGNCCVRVLMGVSACPLVRMMSRSLPVPVYLITLIEVGYRGGRTLRSPRCWAWCRPRQDDGMHGPLAEPVYVEEPSPVASAARR